MFGRDDSDDECVSIDVTPRPPRRSLLLSTNSEQEEGYQPTVEDDEYDDDDPPSMTLKEILLTADTSHFDLLGMPLYFGLLRKYTDGLPEADSDDLEDGFLPEDTSFVWE